MAEAINKQSGFAAAQQPGAAAASSSDAAAAPEPLGGLRERLIFDAVCGGDGCWQLDILQEEIEFVESIPGGGDVNITGDSAARQYVQAHADAQVSICASAIIRLRWGTTVHEDTVRAHLAPQLILALLTRVPSAQGSGRAKGAAGQAAAESLQKARASGVKRLAKRFAGSLGHEVNRSIERKLAAEKQRART